MNKFMLKYENELNALKRELDDCIQGMWRTVDYANGERSELLIDRDKIVVLFGDTATFNRAQLTMNYSEEGDNLVIEDITPIHTGSITGFEGAYSEKVLSLVKYVIRGKSEKEVVLTEIAELKEKHGRDKIRVDRLIRNLAREKERMEETKSNIEHLENQTVEINSREETSK